MKEVKEILENLEKSGFWGEITITFKDGVMVLVSTHETKKLNKEQ